MVEASFHTRDNVDSSDIEQGTIDHDQHDNPQKEPQHSANENETPKQNNNVSLPPHKQNNGSGKNGTPNQRSKASSSLSDLWNTYWDYRSFTFAARACLVLTSSTLFVLVPPPSDPWEEGVWVFITVAITTLLPRSDLATYIKKVLERLAGTLVGCALGLGVGFLSLLIDHSRGQAILIGCAFGVETFVHPYLSNLWGYRSHYGYALINLTFGIVLLAFYNNRESSPWEPGLYRVINIVLGCAMSLVAAVVLWPLSTHTVVAENVQRQMKLAGTSARLVLLSAHQHLESALADPTALSSVTTPPNISDLVEHDELDDAAHTAYLRAMMRWKDHRATLDMLRYDPMYRGTSEPEQAQFVQHMKGRLARALRVQVNAIQLDSMLRGGGVLLSMSGCDAAFVQALKDAGVRMEHVMDLSVDVSRRTVAAHELLHTDLKRVRTQLLRHTNAHKTNNNADPCDSTTNLEETAATFCQTLETLIPKHKGMQSLLQIETMEQGAVFLRLVEHLIVRAVSFHQYCLEYTPPQSMALRTANKRQEPASMSHTTKDSLCSIPVKTPTAPSSEQPRRRETLPLAN